MRLLMFILSILLVMPAIILAQPVQLRGKVGAVYEGEIKLVKNSAVYLQVQSGETLVIPMSYLDSRASQTVRAWIRKKGGSEKYASWIGTTEKSFSRPWPGTVYGPTSIELKKIQGYTRSQPLVYESAHFHFVIHADVEVKAVRQFAVLFEASYNYMLSLPVNVSAHYMENDEKFQIQMFGCYADYHRAGGPHGSAGVYMPRTKSVLVPLPVLGVSWDGRRWESVKRQSNAVLSHELAHQLNDGVDFSAWYSEGAAEYVAATRYTHGAYHGTTGKQRVFEYVRAPSGMKDGSGRRLGTRVSMPSLEAFMNLSYREFTGARVHENYGVALLLTHYFYHADGRGDGARIKAYIKARQQGRAESEAQKLLLAGRSYLQLQEAFRKYCAQSGVKIEFPK